MKQPEPRYQTSFRLETVNELLILELVNFYQNLVGLTMQFDVHAAVKNMYY